MRILVFDTETTGVIPRGIKNVTMTNLDSLPHIVQISYVICDSDYSGKIVKIANHIIRIPKNIIMDDKNISIHRITNEMSQKNGEELGQILIQFANDLNGINQIVAHNIEFDLNIIKAEYYRLSQQSANTEKHLLYLNCYEKLNSMNKKMYCTMKETTDICNVTAVNIMDGKTFVKWPSLAELHNYLFGIIPIHLHNSLHDVFVCLRCFYKLKFQIYICEENLEMELHLRDLLPKKMNNNKNNKNNNYIDDDDDIFDVVTE